MYEPNWSGAAFSFCSLLSDMSSADGLASPASGDAGGEADAAGPEGMRHVTAHNRLTTIMRMHEPKDAAAIVSQPDVSSAAWCEQPMAWMSDGYLIELYTTSRR
jgi:hypothetical protein